MSNISFNPDALKRTDSNEGSMSGRMKAVWFIVKWLWWLGVAYLPYALDTLRQDFRDSIGCSPRGDCYVPGAEILFDFDLLVLGSAAFLWPVAAWFLVAAPFLALWRKLRPDHSLNPDGLRSPLQSLDIRTQQKG